VHPNSSLGADDRLFTVVPTSHLAWHGISHAVDYLDMYLNALVEHRMSFAIAPQSLARSGLLGAAHALWLLDAPSRRERQLRDLAQRAADRVGETGKMLQLEPMSALERRWVHIALRDNPGVATQSIGEEPNRRVVVLPREV